MQGPVDMIHPLLFRIQFDVERGYNIGAPSTAEAIISPAAIESIYTKDQEVDVGNGGYSID